MNNFHTSTFITFTHFLAYGTLHDESYAESLEAKKQR